ncbi:MAG: arginase family protein [Chloroflexi bacterium]|nr:MAG: arginase family protein [Chloroflexota bacterium]
MGRTFSCASTYPESMTGQTLGLLGVPSSAGAHGPGQEKAPSALRAAGLVEALRAGGLSVDDLGDLPLVRFRPDPTNPKQQSVGRVREVADRVAESVERAVAGGLLPVILGGDCTITLGVVAGLLRSTPALALLYFDGDADLTTPETTHSGIFDGMGIAHLTGAGAAELTRMGQRYPLLPEDHIALFGFHPHELEPDDPPRLQRSAMLKYPVTSLERPPLDQAREAMRLLEERADAVLVHFDVDVLDSAEVPLGDWPHYQALALVDAMQALKIFISSPKLAGLVITEINPDHDPDGSLVRRFVDGLSRALQPLAPQPAAP